MSRLQFSRRAVLGAFLGAAALPGRAAFARPFDDVVSSGALRVALYRDNAPFSDDPGGKPIGIDVDLARKIAGKLGVKAEIRIVEASENVDGDFRLNLWRGDLAGSGLADLMLNVPADKMLAVRNEQVFFTIPYFEQRLSVAYRRGSVENGFQDVEDIKGRPVAVEGTSPVDGLLGFASGGIYRDSLRHFRTFADAAKAFFDSQADFLAGSRAAIEGELFKLGAPGAETYEIKDLAGTGLVKARWEICGAVRSDSRDLGYRVGEAMTSLAASSDMAALFAAHGASYAPPSGY